MKTVVLCSLTFIAGFAAAWLWLRPEFGHSEKEFYNRLVYYRAQVAADGHYGAMSSTLLACDDLRKIADQISNKDFAERARGLIGSFRFAHEETGAKSFMSMADNFVSIYAPRMQ